MQRQNMPQYLLEEVVVTPGVAHAILIQVWEDNKKTISCEVSSNRYGAL